MKRIGGKLWTRICERSNIRKAVIDATRKSNEPIDMESWIEEIRDMLVNETYEFHPLKRIVRYEPKERIIDYAITYPDKVLIGCVMNELKPMLVPKFTETTYSSIKGRGLLQCCNRIKKAVRRYPDAYYLQTDIRKFYPSIDHEICQRELSRYIKDAKCLRFLERLIGNYDNGIPIGISAGSYLGNMYLTRIDRWIYEELRPLAYVRYMDDQLMIFHSKEEAHKAKDKLRMKLSEFRLEIKNNARICPVNRGISMVGYVFYPTHTRLRKNIRENMKRKARRVYYLEGTEWKRQMASYHGWCTHGDCKHLMRKTFGNKYDLFMEYKRLSEKKQQENFFGLPKESRVSIRDLVNKDVVMVEYMDVTIRGEPKMAVKFCFPDDESPRLFLTRSETLRDKINRDRDYMPCVVTILERTNKAGRKYYTYE